MIKLLLLRLWPALIPLLLYLMWLYYRKRQAAKGIETPPELLRGVRFWMLVASFVLLVISFLILDFTRPAHREGKYVPPKYEDGKLTPAHSEPQ